MEHINYSVLMAVYKNDQFNYLKEAVNSILNQTSKTNDFIILVDGPIDPEVKNYLISLKQSFSFIDVVYFVKNLGLGVVLADGVLRCKNEFIMRMDSDDISLPNRAEIILDIFKKNNDLSVIGSFVIEFDNNSLQKRIKKNPVTHSEIKKILKFKNPMNHPSVMFKKQAVINSGNYVEYKLNEDYFLWARMLINNYRFYNINQPLLEMRINKDTFQRRGGYNYFKIQNKIYKYLLTNKQINYIEFISGFILRFFFRVVITPNLRGKIYNFLLREKLK